MAKLSVVICTLEREEALNECIRALHRQTCNYFDIIKITGKGPLAYCRNVGLSKVTTPMVSFIDDDTVPYKGWVASVIDTLRSPGIVCATGPAIIPKDNRQNRILFKYPHIKRLHDWLWLDVPVRPSHINRSGAATIIADDIGYEGPCHFPEACNMSFSTKALREIGGFDEGYTGVGEWSEPDVGFRLRRRFGDGCIYYRSACALEHRPSQSGVYRVRFEESRQRLLNYRRFAEKWVQKCPKHNLYQNFLWSYYIAWPRIARLGFVR